MADELVSKHWPHVSALLAALDGMDGRTVTVGQQAADDRELAERVAKELNRAGGPKISQKAIT